MATFYASVYRRNLVTAHAHKARRETHHNYHDGAVAERKEQSTSDWELSKADKSPGGIVDGTVCGLALEERGRCSA
jgi:hypothetical protein